MVYIPAQVHGEGFLDGECSLGRVFAFLRRLLGPPRGSGSGWGSMSATITIWPRGTALSRMDA